MMKHLLSWSGAALVFLIASPGRAEVEIADMRVAFEASETGFLVRQMIILKPSEGESAIPKAHVALPFPVGATGARLSEEHSSEGLSLGDRAIRVDGEIPTDGRAVAVMYDLAGVDGQIVFEQRFAQKVRLAHVAYVGPNEGVHIEGPGFSAQSVRETPSGLPALFSVARDFEDGRVRVVISGIGKRLMDVFAVVVTFASFGMLLVGFLLWLRRSA